MLKENETIKGGVTKVEDVEDKVRKVHVKGLNYDKAKELGVFNRVNNLLCVIHKSICAAYEIFGEVDYIMEQLHARKNEIAMEMNAFERAFDRFFAFFSSYYKKNKDHLGISQEAITLSKKLLQWSELPEKWQVGDKQFVDALPKEDSIRVKLNDNQSFTFFTASKDVNIAHNNETHGVLCYNPNTGEQKSVHTDMDKASALMVAKRLSNENKENLYSVVSISDVVERRTDIKPLEVFVNNEKVGENAKN